MPIDIDWKFTNLALHTDGPMTGGFSSGPTCRIRSYSLKLFHLRLPTGQHLKEKYPTIYETNECPFCSKSESQIHIWQCSNKSRKAILYQTLTTLAGWWGLDPKRNAVMLTNVLRG